MSIILQGVSYIYQAGSPYETRAISDINLEINEGEFVGLIGHTGSGKSTLVQHLNGLIKPTEGKVIIDDKDITVKGVKLKDIRQNVGLVFQYPEHQLFEETVYEDVAFGPKNIGLSANIVAKRVKKALSIVNLDFDKYQAMSPFILSGGEKRRVAIAGVLAMEPKYLVLDEPTAGLDPKGRDEILEQIVKLHHKEGLTVVLVSHSMDDVARLANRLVVMHQGKVVYNDSPRKVFSEHSKLQEMGLDIPTVAKLMHRLKEKGWAVSTEVLTVDEAKKEIVKVMRGDMANA